MRGKNFGVRAHALSCSPGEDCAHSAHTCLQGNTRFILFKKKFNLLGEYASAQKQLSRLVIMQCSGYIFWQLFL